MNFCHPSSLAASIESEKSRAQSVGSSRNLATSRSVHSVCFAHSTRLEMLPAAASVVPILGVSTVPAFFVRGIGDLGTPRTRREESGGVNVEVEVDRVKGKGSTLTRCRAEAAVNLSLVITYTKFYLITSCLDRVCLEGEVWKQFDPQGPNC